MKNQLLRLLLIASVCIPAGVLLAQFRELQPGESPVQGDRVLVSGQLVEPDEWQKLDPSAEWRTERPAVSYRLLGQSDWTHGTWFVRIIGSENWLMVTQVRTTGIRAGDENWTWEEASLMLERSRTCADKSWEPCRAIAP